MLNFPLNSLSYRGKICTVLNLAIHRIYGLNEITVIQAIIERIEKLL